MADSVLREKSKDFAKQIVFICRKIKTEQHETVLANQLLRCGTSVGANIHEAQYAQGTRDLISKLEIALKECYESEYWIDLLHETGFLEDETFRSLRNDCGTLRRMLIASVSTVKKNREHTASEL